MEKREAYVLQESSPQHVRSKKQGQRVTHGTRGIQIKNGVGTTERPVSKYKRSPMGGEIETLRHNFNGRHKGWGTNSGKVSHPMTGL